MFKGFQDTRKSKQFNGFPNLNHQMNNSAYGFTGCTFWLDAASGLNTQTNLASVSTWKDKVQGISFEQLTAGSQPRLVLSDASFNNKPVIDFIAGSTRFMAASKIVPCGVGFTIACVFVKDANSVINNRIYGLGDNGGFQLSSGGPVGFPIGFKNAGSNVFVGTTNDNAAHILVCTDKEIVIDGVSEGTSSGNTNISSFDYLSAISGNYRMNGKLAELIIFKGELGSTDLINLSANINAKYAIY